MLSENVLSRTTLGTSCVGSGLGRLETKTPSHPVMALWSSMALPSCPHLGQRDQAFVRLYFPVFGYRQLPLPEDSCRRDSEGGSQPTFPAAGRMSTLPQSQDVVGATQHPLSYAHICFFKTSALLRYNLHTVKFGGF